MRRNTLLRTLMCFCLYPGGSQSPAAHECPGYGCLHGNSSHPHSGVQSGGGGEQGRGIHRGSAGLFICLQFCLRLGVSPYNNGHKMEGEGKRVEVHSHLMTMSLIVCLSPLQPSGVGHHKRDISIER